MPLARDAFILVGAVGGRSRPPPLTMVSDELDEGVKSFLEQHVHTHEELHCLLLLNRESGRSWTLDQVAIQLNEPRENVQLAALALEARGLISGVAKDGLEPRIPDAATRERVEMLIRAYSALPLAVVQTLSDQAIERLRRSLDVFARGIQAPEGPKRAR